MASLAEYESWFGPTIRMCHFILNPTFEMFLLLASNATDFSLAKRLQFSILSRATDLVEFSSD
jgi:hypothetical protein